MSRKNYRVKSSERKTNPHQLANVLYISRGEPITPQESPVNYANIPPTLEEPLDLSNTTSRTPFMKAVEITPKARQILDSIVSTDELETLEVN